jgi:hypothetical protein
MALINFSRIFCILDKKVIKHCTIISTNLLHIARNVFPTLIKIHLLYVWYLRFCDTLSLQGNKNKRITVANSSMNLFNLVNHSLLFFLFFPPSCCLFVRSPLLFYIIFINNMFILTSVKIILFIALITQNQIYIRYYFKNIFPVLSKTF